MYENFHSLKIKYTLQIILIKTFAVAIKLQKTSTDVLPSKDQVLCEYCTLENIADTLISLFPFQFNYVRRDSSPRNT